MSIEVIDIHKRFGDFVALDQINLKIPTGSLMTLLGSSGCGKTTLLRIIAGLEFANAGEIFFDGERVTDTPVQARKIGFMFQNYALFRHKTVFDNIAFGLQMLPKCQRPKKEQIAERVRYLLQLVQLENSEKKYPHQLSGGQKQRIALARALATEPKLLLLDEPFGALDAKVRKELRHWLKQIHHDLGITSLMVTHDQEEARAISDGIVVMNQGRIEQIGTAKTLIEHPKTPFVAEFFAD